MIYLTHTRLMDESEFTVRERALHGDAQPKRICKQLLSDSRRYAVWHTRQDRSMTEVADQRRRDRQILALRAAALEQVHCTALVDYLREYVVTGTARAALLAEFYGLMDPRDAMLAAHRHYLVAESSHLCAVNLLELAGDSGGQRLLQNYQLSYGQYFSLFCDRAAARRAGANSYLFASLVPEARANASRLKQRILGGTLLPRGPTLRHSRQRMQTSADAAAPGRTGA